MTRYKFFTKLIDSHCFKEGYHDDEGEYTGSGKSKIFTGFRDMENCFTGHRDPTTPSMVGPHLLNDSKIGSESYRVLSKPEIKGHLFVE